MFDIDGGFKTLILWWESFSKFKTARVILYMKVQGNEKKKIRKLKNECLGYKRVWGKDREKQSFHKAIKGKKSLCWGSLESEVGLCLKK